jgi:hypothetical protein
MSGAIRKPKKPKKERVVHANHVARVKLRKTKVATRKKKQ